jgi:hypothetical protein
MAAAIQDPVQGDDDLPQVGLVDLEHEDESIAPARLVTSGTLDRNVASAISRKRQVQLLLHRRKASFTTEQLRQREQLRSERFELIEAEAGLVPGAKPTGGDGDVTLDPALIA